MKSQSVNTGWLDQLDKWLTPVMANLLWVALSLPLITLPAATAALFATMFYWMYGKQPEMFSQFFVTMRRCWLRSSLVVVLDLLVCGLIVVNLLIFQMMDMTHVLAFLSRSATVFVGLLLVLVNVYVWPLLAVWDVPLRQILSFALQLVFAHPLWSIGVALATLVPPIIASVLLLPAAVMLFGGVSCSAYIACWGTWQVARRYLSAGDLSF